MNEMVYISTQAHLRRISERERERSSSMKTMKVQREREEVESRNNHDEAGYGVTKRGQTVKQDSIF